MINETRRMPRRLTLDTVPIIDTMTAQVLGRLGNLSETGLLMLTSDTLRENTLYQVHFTLPSSDGHDLDIDAGVHLLWIDRAHASGQVWAGFRILTLSDEQRESLRTWVHNDTGPS